MSRTTPKKNAPRRSISVKGITYQRLFNYTGKHEDMSISGYVENLILEDLNQRGEPEVTEVTDFPKEKKKKKDPNWPRAGGVNLF